VSTTQSAQPQIALTTRKNYIVAKLLKTRPREECDKWSEIWHEELHIYFTYFKLTVGNCMITQHKKNLHLKSPLLWYWHKRELHPTGTLSGILTSTAYVNPKSEVASVIAVKTLFCGDVFQCSNEEDTVTRWCCVSVIYSKYTETCETEYLLIYVTQMLRLLLLCPSKNSPAPAFKTQ